jgi:pyridinium-3,5-biscarboxylic acid mononucleotide synthase
MPADRVADLGDARLDLDRTRRTGMPEAVYGAGKTAEQCRRIVEAFLERTSDPVVVTRTTTEQRAQLVDLDPQAVWSDTVTFRHRPRRDVPPVAVVSGGTSDQWVVDECQATLTALGAPTRVVRDVGVAGLHRLLGQLEQFDDVSAVVAVAGMEAALPTVLAGLVAAPVIAVPTSVGYGSSLGGVTALLSMLSSCAPGVSVVGIDNGYGAACAALRILGPGR